MSVAQEAIDRLTPTMRPTSRVIGYQRWREMLFLHWRVSPAEIAAHLPDSLDVDTCEGCGWVGIVLFRMQGVRPWWSPAVPGVSAFPETNVRTYVHRRGRDPGIWFWSLDAQSTLGAKLGRLKWGLPYHRSQMSIHRRGSEVEYNCERQWPGQLGVGGTVAAEVGDLYCGLDNHIEAGRAVPGSLEHFLVERYFLYARKRAQLFRGQVHHLPYRLRECRLLRSEQSWLKDLGFRVDRPPDHVLFSEGVSTEIFPLQPVATGP